MALQWTITTLPHVDSRNRARVYLTSGGVNREFAIEYVMTMTTKALLNFKSVNVYIHEIYLSSTEHCSKYMYFFVKVNLFCKELSHVSLAHYLL